MEIALLPMLKFLPVSLEDNLVKMGMGLFMYFLHDDYVRKFRKMLTVEQFNNPELAELFTKQYADDPLCLTSRRCFRCFQAAAFSKKKTRM